MSEQSYDCHDMDLYYLGEELRKSQKQAAKYRNSLMWILDRMSIDGGMTQKQTERTIENIKNVLQGKPSDASDYAPDEWSESWSAVKPLEDA